MRWLAEIQSSTGPTWLMPQYFTTSSFGVGFAGSRDGLAGDVGAAVAERVVAGDGEGLVIPAAGAMHDAATSAQRATATRLAFTCRR